MLNRCMDYINKNDILNEKQFGFRSNHPTYMAVIELVDKVTSAVERNESTLGIFFFWVVLPWCYFFILYIFGSVKGL